ncbi:hypothetical protein [Piscinibacter sakaiensis]|uniref:hypothetical protein n=1 Tax=Piscinibacter sakaiensis TaxID=1547922 RepID=UPI003AB04C75
MSDLKRPLDPAAVKAADDAFYAKHPEFIAADGSRIPLSATDPTQAALRREWRNAYVAAGGGVAGGGPGKKPGPGAQPCDCPGDDNGGGGGGTSPKPDKPGTKPGEPVPTLKVRWSKPWVTPDHNSGWPPATPPTDVVPEEAKVELIGETTNVPDGSTASMTIHLCHSGAQVKEGQFNDLVVQGGKVVDPATGKPPEWVFDASHDIWRTWNRPFYYFKCSVNYKGLNEETPKDFTGQRAACLTLKYWHPCVAESSTLAGVLPEANAVAAVLNGVRHSKAQVQNLTVVGIGRPDWGSLLRNSYVFHMASHGNVLKRSDNSGIGVNDPGESTYTKSEWRSIVHITPVPRFGDAQIKAAANVPSVPRYLFYSSTCLTGWEPSFANAMIGRGTRNVLAFRRTIPDAEAPLLADKFYKRWATYKLNPAKIPDCFFATAADHYTSMKPILYGAGGGQIEAWTSTMNAISDMGAAIGNAIAGWFK